MQSLFEVDVPINDAIIPIEDIITKKENNFYDYRGEIQLASEDLDDYGLIQSYDTGNTESYYSFNIGQEVIEKDFEASKLARKRERDRLRRKNMSEEEKVKERARNRERRKLMSEEVKEKRRQRDKIRRENMTEEAREKRRERDRLRRKLKKMDPGSPVQQETDLALKQDVVNSESPLLSGIQSSMNQWMVDEINVFPSHPWISHEFHDPNHIFL